LSTNNFKGYWMPFVFLPVAVSDENRHHRS
jgi:hypothetical protein